MKNALLFIGCLGVSFLGPPQSWGLSIHPGYQVISLKAGTSQKVTYEITNDQPDPLTISTAIRDSFVLPENKDFPAKSWIEPLFQKETIPVRQSRKVSFKIHVPEKATGELAGFISFIPESPPVKAQESPQEKGIQTRIVTMITVSLYARIQGTEKGDVELGDVHLQNMPAQQENPASLAANVTVKNTGNVHQRPSGWFEITKEDGTPVKRMNFAVGWPTMPQQARVYNAYADDVLPEGRYEVKAHVEFAPKVFMEKKVSLRLEPAGSSGGLTKE